MFKSKKDVDRHVQQALSKLRSQNERNLRGFTIAKLYFKLNEYSSAIPYISAYLSVKEECAPAYKLLGQCYQKLNNPDKALLAFQRSLQLDPKQRDLLIEICKLLLADKTMNANKAKFWCDLAESEKIQHEAVFGLRLKLLDKDSMESEQVEELILKEIASRPNDINMRVRLVKHFIDQDKILDAFKYAYDLQMKNQDLFSNCPEWYNIVALTLNKYKQLPTAKSNWDFWLLWIICLEKQVEISFTVGSTLQNSGTTETANLLFNLDQCLFEASRCVSNLCPEKDLAAQFLQHFKGQFCLHAATLIFKRDIVQNKNQWNEATKNALPLLFLAYQSATPDIQAMWMKHCTEQTKYLIQRWNREGSFRCAQAGRTILTCLENTLDESLSSQVHQVLSESNNWSNTDEILAQVRQFCSDSSWRSKIFRLLFHNSDHLIKMQSSIFINCKKLSEPIYEFPTEADIGTYEEIAQYLKPQSLQHMVYLCLGLENLSDVRCTYFNGLNFSTQNLSFCGAESLNQLDIDSFLYAAVIQAKHNFEVERSTYENYNSKGTGRPVILPFANIVDNLCTEEQISWWSAAYQVYKNLTGDNFSEIRATLQYGIEAVRGINDPKIDLIIILKLGKIFLTRSQDILKSTEKGFLEARAENLFKYGLNLFKLHHKGVLEPYRKLFKYSNSISLPVDRQINVLAEEAVQYLVAKYFKNAEYEECIEELYGIQLPFATYFQAEAYRKLDESNKTPKKTKKIYIDKARDCLNQTLNLLGQSNIDSNHPLHSIVHSEIKRLQYTKKFTNDAFGNGHYTDSEEYFNDAPFNSSRARRDIFAPTAQRSTELENLVKQMASSLTFLKEEISDMIKTEVSGIKKELATLKETIDINMKKKSNPPSRDEEANVLEDLYIIDDELQNQIYSNQQNVYPSYNHQQQQQQQQQQAQRINTPGSLVGQQNHHAPAVSHHPQQPTPNNPYNNPIYNANYPINYFQQYLMPGAHPNPTQLQGQRPSLGLNQHLPFVEHTLNFSLPAAQSQQLPLHQQDSRSSLFGLLTQSNNPQNVQEKLPTQPVISSGSNMWNRIYNNAPVEKGPPVNVVITSSDPLPTNNTSSLSQPALSVTIPSHHIKPSLVPNEPINTPSQLNTNFPIIAQDPSISMSNMMAAITPPVLSFKPNTVDKSVKPTDTTLNNTTIESVASESLNRSGDGEYDPRPDFKPVIPLPDEVDVKTGEEDEEVLFCARAKLLRYVEKEWKERGLGDMKILKNKDGKSRILMRREQTHKICANHIITGEMNLTQPKNEEKSYIWAANDFADEELKVEKLCVRFKFVDVAKNFYNVFMKARDEAKKEAADIQVEQEKENTKAAKEVTKANPAPSSALSKSSTFNFGASSTPITKGATFTATTVATTTANTSSFVGKSLFATSIRSKDSKPATEVKPSPFASFSFDKTPAESSTNPSKPFANIFATLNKTQSPNVGITTSTLSNFAIAPKTPEKKEEHHNKSVSDAEDDYVPTAQFEPVIPLPDLVEVQTGEENEKVLFEHRAKLLRFDKDTKEWKERGIGNMKILVDTNDPNRVRLVMRREVVHKLCCNQRLTKDMEFKKAGNSETALTWCGQDFSESELHNEVLTIRFKTAEICKSFRDTILKAQANMTDDNKERKSDKKDVQQKTGDIGFGDKFKSAPGSWNCNSCYLSNTGNKCVACGENKPGTTTDEKKEDEKKKPEKSFTFGIPAKSAANTDVVGFGYTSKPGSWSCKNCGTSNNSDNLYCVACQAPKDASASKKTTQKSIFGVEPPKTTFTFGFSASTPDTTKVAATENSAPKAGKTTQGFGDKFKPKSGSWTCKSCYVLNEGNIMSCLACDTPKDNTVLPKKDVFSGISPNKFMYGFLNTTSDNPTSTVNSFTFGIAGSTPSTFSLGGANDKSQSSIFSAATTVPEPSVTSVTEETKFIQAENTLPAFSFATHTSSIFNVSSQPDSKITETTMSKPTFSFGSPKLSEEQPDIFKLEKKDFNFSLKPKAQAKAKSPLKNTSGTEDASDSENVEEENNTYFTPVIPLPDKVDVITGEENEEVLYCHRAKLYRFCAPEWKERGLGDVKILRHKESKKLRVVMRREQVLKICLNHVLSKDVEYKKKDDKSWQFAVKDFSEGELETMLFCLRFKNSDIANEFMIAVEKAISGDDPENIESGKSGETSSKIESTPKSSKTLQPEVNDISEEDKKLAEELQLPYEFFSTKITECPGCRGCNPESFEFPNYENSENSTSLDPAQENPLPLNMPNLSSSKENNNTVLKESALSFVIPKSTEKNVFGGISQPSIEPSNFLFGSSNTWGSSNDSNNSRFLFGNQSTNGFSSSERTKLIFGDTSVFGGASAATTVTDETSKSIFGGSLAPAPKEGGNIFSASPFSFSLRNSGNSTSLFGGNTNIPSTTTINNLAEPLFKLEGALSFQSLAKVGETKPAFRTTENTSEFYGLTANKDAFKNFLTTIQDSKDSNNKSTASADGNTTGENEEGTYDPHYEPIIPLPKQIVIQTGEEEETKLFGERATLYRYDAASKQWKERGVGELKLLYHPDRQTYRLILRREQIHKLVLNHALTTDFNMSNLSKNEKAFCWAAMNYAEEPAEIEQLAARFKNVDIAKRFENLINDSIAKLKERGDDIQPQED